jgi:hypothetical protein
LALVKEKYYYVAAVNREQPAAAAAAIIKTFGHLPFSETTNYESARKHSFRRREYASKYYMFSLTAIRKWIHPILLHIASIHRIVLYSARRIANLSN